MHRPGNVWSSSAQPPPATTDRSAPAAARPLSDFRLLRQLGQGGMSDVYLAFDPQTQLMVAIKILSEKLAHQRAFVDRFLREAALSRRLSHPNLVFGLDSGKDPETGHHYLVLEYIDGPNAQQLLDRRGPLPIGVVVQIAIDIARALEYLHHRNFVHRDVKPDNILLTLDGTAKLCDLGLIKHLDDTTAHLTALNDGFGSSFYMPYEQALNAGLVDARSDIFSLGATLYHLLTAEVPFGGADHLEIVRKKEKGEFLPASRHNPQVPPSIDAILARMLERDPRRRYESARHVREAFEACGIPPIRPTIEYRQGEPHLSGSNLAATDDLTPTRPDLQMPAPAAPLRPEATAPSQPNSPHSRQETASPPQPNSLWRCLRRTIGDAHAPWSLLAGLTSALIALVR